MPIISKPQLLRNPTVSRKSYDEVRRELRSVTFKKNPEGRYDIFLSHRSEDAKIIYGLKVLLESFGFAVFVDWIEAPLDRSKVSPETAAILRTAMKQSNSLVYAASDNSSSSKWMPWELGYSDGLHGRVAILPISEYETIQESYAGQEYLGLYPYVTTGTMQSSGQTAVWINKSPLVYTTLKNWISGGDFRKHAT